MLGVFYSHSRRPLATFNGFKPIIYIYIDIKYQLGTLFFFTWSTYFVKIYLYVTGGECTLMHLHVTF